jgi:hypothetical protein
MAERIAVIAIHGVGDHQPFEMARSVANMLEDLRDPVNASAVEAPGKSRYCAFSQSTFRLNVAPVKVKGHAARAVGNEAAKSKWPWRTLGPLDRLLSSQVKVNRAAEASIMSVDHLFMEGQLEQYVGEGPEDTYEVLRLEGNRYKDAPVGPQDQQPPAANAERTPGKQVHVYDMFWSDLSGLSKTGLRVFGELYQVLFHLGSIGVNNVKAASVLFQKGDSKTASLWRTFSSAQIWPATLLALPLPFLNLILFALAVTLFATSALRNVNLSAEVLSLAGLLCLAAASSCGFWIMRRGSFRMLAFRFPFLAALFLFVLAVAFTNRVSSFPEEVVRRTAGGVAALLVFTALITGVVFIVRFYNQVRPQATTVFFIVLAAVTLTFFVLAFQSSYLPQFAEMQVLLRAIEAGFWLLMLSWFLFWIALVWAFFSGARAVRATHKTNPEEWERARRTGWTARLTVGLPALLFLLFTYAVWTGTLKTAMQLLPQDPPNASNTSNDSDCDINYQLECSSGKALCYHSLLVGAHYVAPVRVWADKSLSSLGGFYLPVLLVTITLAAAITLWGIAPSVKTEVSPPRGPLSKVAAASKPLGNWLDEGFRFMRWGGRLIYAAVFLFPLAIGAFLYLSFHSPQGHLYNLIVNVSGPLSKTLGVLVAGAAIGLFGFGGKLSRLGMGLRPLVRVALDVDNWLREHPLDKNPTARICGRYVSLLRYISQWRNDKEEGYDALVIFAHSQGTVITADLLRFLRAEAVAASSYHAYDESLTALDGDIMPIHLFTMGCPLRQLYALRFPYLYDYVEEVSGKQSAPSPSPVDLGVKEWVNAYRTGDYVGRYLWRDDPWEPVGIFSPGVWNPAADVPKNVYHLDGRVEFAIGPGAHTHYWDSTAAPIAQMLDILIAHS